MKKTLLVLLISLLSVGLFAQLDPFMPPNPITFAQGGAFTANAEGMNAFYYNPAGFGNDDGELTLTSVGVYSLVDRSLLDLVLQSSGLSSGSRALASDYGLPPEMDGLVQDMTSVATWLGDLTSTELDAAISAAQTAVADIDPALADAFADPTSLTQEDLAVLVLNADIFGDANGDGTTNLTAILEAMDTAVVGAGGTSVLDATYLNSDFTTFNSNVEDASAYIPGGEMRIGATASMAYIGNGIGLGLFVNADGSFNGDNILVSKGRMLTSVTLAGGLAFPLGPFTIGAQVRPTILGYTDVYPAEMLMNQNFDPATLFSSAVYTGFYFGLDAGALMDLGPFTFGVAVKDILPLVKWTSAGSLDAYIAGLQSGQVFAPDPVDNMDGVYKIPIMKVNVGAQFHPQMGVLSWIIDPRFNVDVQDLFGFLRYINQDENPLTADTATLGDGYNLLKQLHLGAEAKMLGGLASIRAGMYGDYLTAGIGAHLLFLDINAAAGAADLQKAPDGTWAFRQVGLSFEAAIRF